MVGASPKRERNRYGIDFDSRPPCHLVALPVELMKAAERHGELVADFASQRTRLREAKMVRIGRFAAAHDARLLGHELDVVFVAQPNGLAGPDACGVSFLSGGF
jgi:hypothetical protein